MVARTSGEADRLGQRGRRTGAQPGQGGHAERGRVGGRAHLDRRLQQVGLGLHEQPGAGQPAVHPQDPQRRAAVGGHRPGQQRDRRRRCPRPPRGPGAPRVVPRPRPRNAPRASGRQCGAPSPASAGRNVTPAGVGHARAGRVQAGRAVQQAQPGQPASAPPPRCRPGRPGSSWPRRPAARPPTRTARARTAPRPARWWRAGTPRSRRCTWPRRARSRRSASQRRLLVHGQPGDRQRRCRTPPSPR